MRKFVFPVSMIVLVAMLLAACAGAAATPAAPTTAVTTGTPAAVASPSAAVTAQTTSTSQATAAATTRATAQATTAATTAATAAATTGATQAATANPAQTGTPQAAAPGTNSAQGSVNVGQYVSLTNLLNANVNAKDNVAVGRVDGILVQHPLIPETAESASDQATATPAPTLTAEERVMTVRYLMVNVANSSANSTGKGNEVLVPWQAVAFSGGTQTAGTINLNVASAAVNDAPRETLVNIASGSSAWNASVLQYWTSQGLTIPATGNTSSAEMANNLFLIPRERGSINVADAKDQVLGTTSDILVDPATGQITYLVFNGGAAFNNKEFVVPVNNLTWGPGANAVSVTNRGQFTLNFPTDILKNAPSFDLSQLQLDQNTINTLNQFWQSVQNSAGGTTP